VSKQRSDQAVVADVRTKAATTARLLSELRRQGKRPSKRYAHTLSILAGRAIESAGRR
jgi:hypothetical protein